MIDNKRNGCVADELRQHIGIGSKLSIMTAYFTIFAFSALKSELLKVDQVRMLFTDPSFINDDQEPTKEYYLARNNTPAFGGSIYEIKLRNEMCQASIARECAEWFSKKVQVKMFKERNPAQPRLVHIDNSSDSMSINGTVDFTTDGLGLTPSDRIDSNMCMYGHEFTDQFLRQFDSSGMTAQP